MTSIDKRAYKSGVGFCPGSTFRSIKVGPEEGRGKHPAPWEIVMNVN